MVTYTVAICNLNMAETLEPSLRSVLEQVDERFEVLVVDDGSTDDSVSILERLENEYDQLRVIPLSPDSSRKLGRTRTISIEEARGEHVLLHIDTDNYYIDSITDFVEVYQQLRDQLDFEFYLLGRSFAVVNRDFLLDFGPYRNLPVGGEDRDLWRRLAADDRLIVFEHEVAEKVEGWDYGGGLGAFKKDIKRTFEVKVADFQVGLTLKSYLRWLLQKPWYLVPYHIVTSLLCYVWASMREQYETPSEFRSKEALEQELESRKMTLEEIESAHDVTIDRSQLSEQGVELFCSKRTTNSE